MGKIELFIDYTESIQLVDQTHEITLDNGWEAIVNITADVTVSENIGATFYDESQSSVNIENLEIEITEVWDGEDLLQLSEAQIKEIKREILENII